MACFITSIVFFLTAFRKDDCYSGACPTEIRPWLILIFLAFYGLQALTYALFRIKSRKVALWIWALNSFVLMPGMLAMNIWGNMLIERMDGIPECYYLSFA